MLNAVLNAAPEVLQDTFQIGNISVVTQPHMTSEYGGTVNKVMFLLVAALGLFAGIGIAVLQLFLTPTLMDLRDVENKYGLEVLGEIPLEKGYFDGKVDLLQEAEEEEGIIAECFSSCTHIVRNQLGLNKKGVCIYVTSAIHYEGKTLTAAYLAANLAASEKNVLLIDFDTKKPTLGNLFLPKVEYERSLNAVYRGDIELNDAIIPVSGYLDILSAVLERNPIPLDNSIFEMVRRLKESYDYIILDTAPVGLSSNTMNLNQIADTALFVIRYDYATVSEIRNALGRLDKSGIQVLGCVVNGIQSLDSIMGGGKKKRIDVRRTKGGEAAQEDQPEISADLFKPAAKYGEARQNGADELPPIDLNPNGDSEIAQAQRDELWQEVIQPKHEAEDKDAK